MTAVIQQLGDTTSKPVKPDFEGERFYHWQHMRTMAEQAGTLDKLPRKPRSTPAERSFFEQVDRRLTRSTFACSGVSFDENGRLIR